jgi:serine phosphatase RsbU (regulator of sigma subunit)
VASPEYRQRLDEIEAAVARSLPAPAIALERAAGLLAGRIGCRVEEAHAYLLQRATKTGQPLSALASEVLATLENHAAVGSAGVREAGDQMLRPPRTRPHPTAPTVEPAAGDWVSIVQQVIDGMAGGVVLLIPVRNSAGEVVDYVIAAANAVATDISGRHGADLVGLRAREAYPATVDGPIWHACRDVLVDGLPREVGPLPYAGRTDGVPAHLMISVRVQPVGPGLLNSWIRHDEQTRHNERIAQTERLGNLGWAEADLVTGQVVWSEGMYRIFERDPVDGPLSSEEQDALTFPEDEPLRRQGAQSFGRGETVDITYRIRVAGRIKYLRAVLDAVRDVTGAPVRVYGIVQDVTARETSRAKLAEVEQRLREHQQSLAAEHRLAAQLQHIILPIPDRSVTLPGLLVAVRYLPAEQASRVGGDWYHAAAATDGSLVLAVGDVAGHGIRAAATMAQLRQALAALTVATTDPAELLAYLSRLLYSAGPTGATASAVVARYRPCTRTLVWAQGGHPTPLLARAGKTTELTRPSGALLGAVRAPTFAVSAVVLEPDDLLLFYTDGLIERRDSSLRDGLADVAAVLDQASMVGGERPLSDLLTQLRRANPDDDTCVLAVRPYEADDPSVRSAADADE